MVNTDIMPGRSLSNVENGKKNINTGNAIPWIAVHATRARKHARQGSSRSVLPDVCARSSHAASAIHVISKIILD